MHKVHKTEGRGRNGAAKKYSNKSNRDNHIHGIGYISTFAFLVAVHVYVLINNNAIQDYLSLPIAYL